MFDPPRPPPSRRRPPRASTCLCSAPCEDLLTLRSTSAALARSPRPPPRPPPPPLARPRASAYFCLRLARVPRGPARPALPPSPRPRSTLPHHRVRASPPRAPPSPPDLESLASPRARRLVPRPSTRDPRRSLSLSRVETSRDRILVDARLSLSLARAPTPTPTPTRRSRASSSPSSTTPSLARRRRPRLTRGARGARDDDGRRRARRRARVRKQSPRHVRVDEPTRQSAQTPYFGTNVKDVLSFSEIFPHSSSITIRLSLKRGNLRPARTVRVPPPPPLVLVSQPRWFREHHGH